MASKKKVIFTIHVKVNKPKVVRFSTKDGEFVKFTATEKVTKPKIVRFYAKSKKKSI